MPECRLDPASPEVADFIEPYRHQTPDELAKLYGSDCFYTADEEQSFILVYRPLRSVLPLSLARYGYSSIPKLYGLLDTTAPTAAGITSVLGNPNVPANGDGVIIGFIDTGIDYQNPLFRFSDGTSRIISLWDQTIPPTVPGVAVPATVSSAATSMAAPGAAAPATAPDASLRYGTIYSQGQLNAALATDNPLALVPSHDAHGHGTFMAGVAAGNAAPEHAFTGAAPHCMIAAVKLKPAKQYLRDFFLIAPDAPAFQENDIMMAIDYLVGLSKERKAPLVIYLGVGTNQGNHTGRSPLGLLIQSVSAGYGVVFVAGAGNETGRHHHYLGTMAADDQYQEVEIRVGKGEPGFSLELWGNAPDLYTISLISPTGEAMQSIPKTSNVETIIPYYLSQATVRAYYIHVERSTGNPLIFMRFEKPSPGIWRIRVVPEVYFTGIFHMWLPMDSFISPNTSFLKPNPDTLITDPGNSPNVLTVAAYNHIDRHIYIHSSRGFNRDGLIVPIITAPGVDVFGPLPVDNRNQASPRFTRRSGTSVAAAITAGAVADLLSWDLAVTGTVSVTNAGIFSFFIRGAKRNPNIVNPSREWGYGVLDLYGSFQML